MTIINYLNINRMRKFLFISAMALLLSACAVPKRAYTSYSTSFDFTEFTNDGFFITESNSVSFDYDPIGSISGVVTSGYEVLGKDKQRESKMKDDVYYQEKNEKVRYGEYKYADFRNVLFEIVESAKKLGANGIINLDVVYSPGTVDMKNKEITPSYYIASGMAISF